MGLISAIGNSVAENRDSLVAGKSGMSLLEMFPSKYAGINPVGEIKITTQALKDMLDAHEPGITRTTLLALHALKEALSDSQLTSTQISSVDTALINASTVGGMCMTDDMYLDAQKETPGSEYLLS